MTRWFIPASVVEHCAQHAAQSFVGEPPFAVAGVLTLYDKNSNTNWRFSNPQTVPTHYAYTADRDECPRYFARVVTAYERIGR